MQLTVGSIVRSTAGHDADGFYAVTSVQEGYVSLADGKVRKLERPKRKSIKHIRKTNTVLDASSMKTNKKLREALGAFRKDEGGNVIV